MKYKTFFLTILILGVSISAYYLYRFYQEFSVPSLEPITSRTLIFILGAIALQLFGHYLRAYKWRLLLSQIRPTKVRTLFKGVSAGFLYNSILPFRLGEFLRADLVGRAMSISRAVVFSTVVFERLVDGFFLVILGTVLLIVNPGLKHDTHIQVILISLSLVLLAGFILGWLLFSQNKRLLIFIRSTTALFNDQLRDRQRFVSWSTIYGLRHVLTTANLPGYFLLSVIMWLTYLASIYCLILGFSPFTGSINALYASTISYLSVAVPSGPAYLGTYHYFFTTIVGNLLQPTVALYAVSITSWIVMVLPISLCGVLLLLISRKQDREAGELERQLSLRNKLYRDFDISKELSHFLDAYHSGAELSHALSQAEMTGRLKLLRTFKGGSNAITMLVWGENERVVKKMTLPQHADKLKAQYNWLKERAHLPHLPQVLQEDETGDQYSFDIKYAPEYIPFFDYIHSQSPESNHGVISRVVEFMRKHIYQPQKPQDPEGNVRNYVATKVVDKIRDTAALNHQIANLMDYKTLVINGKSYLNWNEVVARILNHPQAMHELSSYMEGPIHGDLTIDNIIVNPEDGDFIVLDPNNENQVSAPVVDMAKLYQSLHSGYEFLCNLTTVKVKGHTVTFEEHISSRYTLLLQALDRQLKADLGSGEYRTILFHEAVHYCRMLTYRAKINPDTVPAFYAIAVRLFNEFLDQYDS